MSWLKIHRQLTGWEWYADADTLRVFLHLLLTVQYDAGTVWTTADKLAETLKIQKHRVVVALGNLVKSGEIEKLESRTGKNGGMLLAVRNWRAYQYGEVAAPPPTETPPAPPAPDFPFPVPKDPQEVMTAAQTAGLLFTPALAQQFFDYYNAIGWTTNAGPIRNWRYKLRTWIQQERKVSETSTRKIKGI